MLRLGWLASVVVVAFLLAIGGCGKANDPWESVAGPKGGKKILVSFPPLYCFAKGIAGDDAKVLCLLQGTGPHDYEPSSNDALKARGADLILINGLDLDGFVSKIVNSSGNRKAPFIKVAETAGLKLLKMGDHDHGHEGHHHHHHGEHDPHVWLGLDEAQKMIAKVSRALQDIDPQHKKEYAEREKELISKVDALRQKATDALKDKKNKKMITMHDSMQYFARSLGLEIVDTIQVRPGVEATAKQILHLVKTCKDKDIRVIGIEPQYPPDLARQISEGAAKLGQQVHLVEIDPIETAPPGFGPSHYFDQMDKCIKELAGKL